MILIGLGLGVPIGLLAVFFYLKNGHSLYELRDNHTLMHYRKTRMEYLGETLQEVNASFDKHHKDKWVGQYRPFTDKLVVFTVSSALAFVCYEFGYKQENFWIFGAVGFFGWIFAAFGLFDDGWERMQGFTVSSPLKHYSVRIPELDARRMRVKREERRGFLLKFLFVVLVLLAMWLVGEMAR